MEGLASIGASIMGHGSFSIRFGSAWVIEQCNLPSQSSGAMLPFGSPWNIYQPTAFR